MHNVSVTLIFLIYWSHEEILRIYASQLSKIKENKKTKIKFVMNYQNTKFKRQNYENYAYKNIEALSQAWV